MTGRDGAAEMAATPRESAQDRGESVPMTPEPYNPAESRQRALFVAVLHEGGFEWGESITLDDPTVARLLGGMAGLGLAIRPVVTRW